MIFFFPCQFLKPDANSVDYPEMAKEAGNLIIKQAFSLIVDTYFKPYS